MTIQSAPGALVYANDAAARLMGFTSPQELLAAPVEDIIESFAPTRDDGTAIAPDEFPGRRVLAGRPAEPMVSRSIDPRDRRRALVADQGDPGPRPPGRG